MVVHEEALIAAAPLSIRDDRHRTRASTLTYARDMAPQPLAGIYVLRGVDAAALQALLQHAFDGYDGSGFGGIDVMAPNPDGDAWLLLGRWTQCLQVPDLQRAAVEVLAQLRRSAELVNAGVLLDANQNATVSVPAGYRVEIVPWVTCHASFFTGIDDARWEQWMTERFPHTPGWVGMHMGAPHWLGRGVSQQDGRIDRVTPYARLDRHGDDGTVVITAVLAQAELDAWAPQLHAALQ